MGNWPACLHYTGVQHCCSSHKLLYLPLWNPWAFYKEGKAGQDSCERLAQSYCHLCLARCRWWPSLTSRTCQVEGNSCESSGTAVGSLQMGAGEGQGGKTRTLYTGQTLKLLLCPLVPEQAYTYTNACADGWLHKHLLWRKRHGDRSLG